MRHCRLLITEPHTGSDYFTSLVESKYDSRVIELGEVIRELIKSRSDLERRLRVYIDNGEVIADDLIIEILASSLKSDDRPVILKNFPVTASQFELLKQSINKFNIQIVKAWHLKLMNPDGVAIYHSKKYPEYKIKYEITVDVMRQRIQKGIDRAERILSVIKEDFYPEVIEVDYDRPISVSDYFHAVLK